jgi:hypothetical protein
MSITFINYRENTIIYYDLHESKNSKKELLELDEFNHIIEESVESVLVLINVSNYMPGLNFMEHATKTLIRRASKIRKAAYVGLSDINLKLWEKYNNFNLGIVNRKNFHEIESACEWLISST